VHTVALDQLQGLGAGQRRLAGRIAEEHLSTLRPAMARELQ
jgi:hypothetical protein